MKIGIFGGTFNPVHIGHLILAEEAREKLGLDRVVFVPARVPPHKDSRDIAPAADRLRMVRLAIKGNKFFSVSSMEILRRGPSYTIDTAKAFKKQFPRDELYFITGSDVLNYLEAWKDLRALLSLVRFVVATRPGYALEKIPTYISTVAIRAVDVSGFEVRQCIKQGTSFRYLVPEAVFAYMKKRKLYR